MPWIPLFSCCCIFSWQFYRYIICEQCREFAGRCPSSPAWSSRTIFSRNGAEGTSSSFNLQRTCLAHNCRGIVSDNRGKLRNGPDCWSRRVARARFHWHHVLTNQKVSTKGSKSSYEKVVRMTTDIERILLTSLPARTNSHHKSPLSNTPVCRDGGNCHQRPDSHDPRRNGRAATPTH